MHFGVLKYLSELISVIPIQDTSDESGKHLCAYLKKAQYHLYNYQQKWENSS